MAALGRSIDEVHASLIRDFKIQRRDGDKNVLKKRICVLSVLVAIIPTH